ncbi:MAG TPA: IS66 family insertion sequence element accessory protein TnpB, partial [Armatimonadota bacterium]
MTHDERRALWQQRLVDQQASGLSIVAWCWQQNITAQQFYAWRKRLATPVPSAAAPQWLAVAQPVAPGASLMLQVGAATITVTAGFDPHLLTEVVRV